MSPRFDEVRRLADLEKKAEPNWIKGDMGNIYSPKSPTRYPLLMPYGINASSAEVQIAVDLRNASPWLLEVAGCFQRGDATLLRKLHYLLDTYHPDNDEDMELIERLLEAAKTMERME